VREKERERKREREKEKERKRKRKREKRERKRKRERERERERERKREREIENDSRGWYVIYCRQRVRSFQYLSRCMYVRSENENRKKQFACTERKPNGKKLIKIIIISGRIN
jgi:hypothetical protein